ncbi:hypothetical protein BDW59DRAFT_180084 [Aspergillus cavernicola]|uniref:Uncharacterized protein n=1 Tax=Aspergillus cavernicola TaxID=176166 RepID=A0ABR4J079_9EURO
MALERSILEYPIPPNIQAEIANQFWGNGGFQLGHLRPYFQYYTEQCRIVYQSHKTRLPLKTHSDIIEIATDILGGLTRYEVRDKLDGRCNTSNAQIDDTLDACIDLTIRLLFMLDVGEFPNYFSGRRKLVWSNGSLRDFMKEVYPEKLPLNNDGIKLGRGFDVYNMVRIAGFNIELTTNLSDHLRLRDADKTVTIFHHASFLKGQRQLPFFPDGLVDETLATLSLLFPQGDRNTEKWYNKQESPDELDHEVQECGSPQRRIDKYNYWHDRLVILKEAFDETRPSTLSQWWNDRREGTQWYTLWVAILLTLLFGLIQSIVGALQLYKTYNP